MQARLGVQPLDLGDDLHELVHLDADRLFQRREVVARQQVQVGEEGRDHGIEAVLFLQLQREAFLQRAREHARRVERLQARQHAVDQLLRRAELLGERGEIRRQVSGVVHHVDEVLADEPLGRLLQDERKLLGEMLAQRDVVGDERLEVDVVVGAGAALAQVGPARGVVAAAAAYRLQPAAASG